ncbi:MAG: hypothetical protein ACRDHS_02555 [Actinomycetota bacterium]
MRRVAIIASLVGTLLTIGAPPASATGVSPAQLGQAGWGCLFVLGSVHCAPPGGLDRVVAGTAETMTFLVFRTEDPAAEEAPFLGTELIIRADLFQGQPCPTDPPGQQYTDLEPLLGLDYFACHRYDSGF